jgi:hypothetical protein
MHRHRGCLGPEDPEGRVVVVVKIVQVAAAGVETLGRDVVLGQIQG